MTSTTSIVTVTAPDILSTAPEPHSYPLGESLPPKDRHAVSVSLPTWDNIVQYMKADRSIHDKLQSDYPRFFQHASVQRLNNAVLHRLKAPETYRCAIFPSNDGMRRCKQYLRKKTNHDQSFQQLPIHEVSFCLVQQRPTSLENANWARFSAVIYADKFADCVAEFWGWMGDGISSRHAEFCLERFLFMESLLISSSPDSDSSLPLQTPPHDQNPDTKIPDAQWEHSDTETKNQLRALIAEWVTPQDPGSAIVRPYEDVFLFPKGMCAIGTIARALVPKAGSQSSEAVVFGWPYGSTPKILQQSGYERFTFYSQGTSEELDQLEAFLQAGNGIACLFCEVPSNPLCATPDLHRIRRLADEHHFVVICDETIGTFINVDVLPYVDLNITSLTKLFSGACNVMGGSVVLNPRSRFHPMLHSILTRTHEDLIFPLDAKVLLHNCLDFPERVRKANHNALAIVNHLQSQAPTLISRVNYPTTVPTKALYEQYRRRQSGGYGSLISVIFREPDAAVRFYDAVDLCKGPSFGANFTLVLPYSQLAHAFELDWAESQGMPKHIVRISVGLEDEEVLIRKFEQALDIVI